MGVQINKNKKFVKLERSKVLTLVQPWSTNFYNNHVYDPDTKAYEEGSETKHIPERSVAVNSLFTREQLVRLYLDRENPEASGGPSRLDNVLTQFRDRRGLGTDRYEDEKTYEVKNDYI